MSFKYELKWAIALAISLILLQWLLLLDKHYNLTVLGWIITAAAISAATIEKKRRAMDNRMSYWQGVRTGTVVAAIAIPFQLLFIYLLFTFIDPDYFQHAVERNLDTGTSRAQLESYYSLSSYLFQTVVFGLGIGFLFSLLISVVLKNK